MDLTTLKAVLSELRKEIVPSRFETAQQPEPQTLQIGLRTLKGLVWLELSWEADSARLVRVPSPSRIGSKSTLAKQIQNCLGQMTLVEIKQKDFERVVEFNLALRPGEPIKRSLILELMGRHSNFLLLNEDKQIITLGRQVRESQSRIRPISTGDRYVPPPPLKGIKPNKSETIDSWKRRLCLTPETLKKNLQSSYQGISPSLSLQLAHEDFEIAIEILNLPVLQISDRRWTMLHKSWCQWLTQLDEEIFNLSFQGPTPYRVWNSKVLNPSKSSKNLALALGHYYQEGLNKKEINSLSKKLRKVLDLHLEHELEALKNQEALLEKTVEGPQLKEEADLILSMPSLTRDSVVKAQKLYEKAKKLKRSVDRLKNRCKHHKQRIELIHNSETYLENLITNTWETSVDRLQRLKELNMEIDDLLKKSNQSKKHKKNIQNQPNPLEIKSPAGLLIQIGRNHRQNELISLRYSKSGDLWFHAQECPGSHVVLKSSTTFPDEPDLQLAADLAAYFSRAKANKKVAVVMTATQNLQRVNNSAPGTVRHRGGTIRWAQPERAKKYLTSNSP